MGIGRIANSFNGWPRRILALLCLILAAWSAAGRLHSSSSARATASVSVVVVAARPLAAGTVLAAADVHTAAWPSSLRPSSALASIGQAVGRTLAGPIGAADLITTERLVGADLTAGLPPGLIAVPVPLVDPSSARLISVGSHVDLLSPPADSATASDAKIVATGVLVVAVVGDTSPSATSGAQLVVAVDRATELRIAGVISSPLLATVINPP